MTDLNPTVPIEQVVGRAATRPDYRAWLLADPRRAVAAVTGRPLADDVTVKFVEKDAGVDAMYVLPDLAMEQNQLTAEELRVLDVNDGFC